jgi:hypothetical protein
MVESDTHEDDTGAVNVKKERGEKSFKLRNTPVNDTTLPPVDKKWTVFEFLIEIFELVNRKKATLEPSNDDMNRLCIKFLVNFISTEESEFHAVDSEDVSDTLSLFEIWDILKFKPTKVNFKLDVHTNVSLLQCEKVGISIELVLIAVYDDITPETTLKQSADESKREKAWNFTATEESDFQIVL